MVQYHRYLFVLEGWRSGSAKNTQQHILTMSCRIPTTVLPLLIFLFLLVVPYSSSLSAGGGTSSISNKMSSIPRWFQHEISITAPSRGCHLITSDIHRAIATDLKQIKIGMCNLFLQHTSASLTINENADPDVRRDMEVALNLLGE